MLAPESPLVLGGHSFIDALGNDPPASPEEQCAIVAACLDRGVRWIDTTYQPERIALGRVLGSLGRRAEATILAWNFFSRLTPALPLGEAEPFRAEHIDVILNQLGTSYVDCLVAIPADDPADDERQLALMTEWRSKGYVRALGLWAPDLATVERHRGVGALRYAFRPCNVTTPDAGPVLAACKAAGWETVATSPFFRGWELDRIVGLASDHGSGTPDRLRSTLADLLLRFALFHAGVDRLIVGMRRVDYVVRNLASVARGPLTSEERLRLLQLRQLEPREPSWWQRLRQILRAGRADS